MPNQIGGTFSVDDECSHVREYHARRCNDSRALAQTDEDVVTGWMPFHGVLDLSVLANVGLMAKPFGVLGISKRTSDECSSSEASRPLCPREVTRNPIDRAALRA